MNLAILSVVVFLLNLPFGYWRSRTKTFSVRWFLAVHLPILLVVALRFYTGIGFEIITYPVLAGAFFAGQYSGAKLSARTRTGRFL